MTRTPEPKDSANAHTRPRDWYRHPLAIGGAAALAIVLVGGGMVANQLASQSVYDQAVSDDSDPSATNAPPETGGILNTLTVEQIDAIYERNYAPLGTPPFNKAQYEIVMRDLSSEDAAYVLSSLQAAVSMLDVSRLLSTNGLEFDDAFPLE